MEENLDRKDQRQVTEHDASCNDEIMDVPEVGMEQEIVDVDGSTSNVSLHFYHLLSQLVMCWLSIYCLVFF